MTPRTRALAALVLIVCAGWVLLKSTPDRRAPDPSAADARDSDSTPHEGAKDAEDLITLSAAPEFRDAFGSSADVEAGTRSTSNPAPGFSMRLRVRDEFGANVARAALFEKVGDSLNQLGETGTDGTLAVSLPAAVRRVIVATRADHSPASALVASPPPDEMVLTLGEMGTISGHVRLADGSPAGEHITIAAMPSHLALFIGKASWERILADPEVRLTSSEPDGSFSVPGLDRKLRYSIVAGGKGYLQREPIHWVSPVEDDLEVLVLGSYAVLIRLWNPDGTPARLEPAYVGGGGVRVALTDTDASFAAGYPLSYWMGGFPTSLQHIDPASRLYVFVSKVDKPAVGPVNLHTSLPGYREATLQLMVGRLDGGIAEEDWILEPDTDSWGTLEVAFRGLPSETGLARRFGPVGFVRLSDENDRVLKYAVHDFTATRTRFENIPRRRYRPVYESTPDHSLFPAFASPDRWIEIGEEPVQVIFDLSKTGSIELHPRDPLGREYKGELTFTLNVGNLEKDEAGNVTWYGGRASFLHPPYILSGLATGSYAVRMEDPLPTQGAWEPVIVEQGRISGVAVPLE